MHKLSDLQRVREQEKEEEGEVRIIRKLQHQQDQSPIYPFMYALKSSEARRQYRKRLKMLFDFLDYQGTKEEKARAFAAKTRRDSNCAFTSVPKFFQSKREQIDRKEMAIGTVRICVKSTKLFCDIADLQIPWAKIAGIKSINLLALRSLYKSFQK
jgi:hypothetical protein